MIEHNHSAAPSMLGYLYQVRCSLAQALGRLPLGQDFAVVLETIDDVVFEEDGTPEQLIQTKHHVNSRGDLTDTSPDLWKTMRIWISGRASGAIPHNASLTLVTTGSAPKGSAASYLAIINRDLEKARGRLVTAAHSSSAAANKVSHEAFLALDEGEQRSLVESITVLDNQPDIVDIHGALKARIYYAVGHNHQEAFITRLEGWWLKRAIDSLKASTRIPILSEELDAEIARLREQFKEDNLPIDDDIMSQSIDGTGYDDRPFVHQLRIIDISNKRVLIAIRNYFRAFEQRSRWVRDDLLIVGELDRYEKRLREEWEIHFEQMKDLLGNVGAEVAMKKAARKLYAWVESGEHPRIRPAVSDPYISRGSYQILADKRRVGWHPDWVNRLKTILEGA